jgi:uncharacterized peroxidase-related enzyme
MRLEILNTGYPLGVRILFRFIRLVSGFPLPDAARLGFYRPDFYGKLMRAFTHEAMGGSSSWSVGERELMAAYISKLNECRFCISAHTETSSQAYHDRGKVAAVLSDLETAPIGEPLKSTLRMLGKLTRQNSVSVEDMRSVLGAGASPGQVEDALAVCFAFNTTNRLADAFDFDMLSREGFEAGAKYLLNRGYK